MASEDAGVCAVADEDLQRPPASVDVPESVTRFSSCDSDVSDEISRNALFQLPLDFCITFEMMADMKSDVFDRPGSKIEGSGISLFQKKKSQGRIIVDELDLNSPDDRSTPAQKAKSGLSRGTSLMTRTLCARSSSGHVYRSLSRGLPVSRLSTMEDGDDGEGEDFGRDIMPEGFHRFKRIPSFYYGKSKPIRKISRRLEANFASSEDESESESHALSCTF